MTTLLRFHIFLIVFLPSVSACVRTTAVTTPAVSSPAAPGAPAEPGTTLECAQCNSNEVTFLNAPPGLQGTAVVPQATFGQNAQGCVTLTVTCTGPPGSAMFMEVCDGLPIRLYLQLNDNTFDSPNSIGDSNTVTETLRCLKPTQWQIDTSDEVNGVNPDINNVACEFI